MEILCENVVGDLTGQVQQGLQVLYKGVFNNVLSLISKSCDSTPCRCSSTENMVSPVGAIQKDLECMVGNVAKGLASTTEKMLESMMESFDDVLGISTMYGRSILMELL